MAKIEVAMPKMGESITEGTVITWYKKPGDTLELDEPLLEIGTDKVDTEVPSPAAGVLQEILVPEGDTVDVGVIIAVLETEVDAAGESAPAEGSPTAEAPALAEASADPIVAEAVAPPAVSEVIKIPVAAEPAIVAEAPEQTSPEAPELDEVAVEEQAPAQEHILAPSSNGGERITVVMPKMGESITEGTVITWYKKPGDVIELDEALLEIGTDKVDTEVPSPAAGTLAEILVPEGETVEVGTEIAIIATGADINVPIPAGPTPAPENSVPAVEVSPPETPQIPTGDGAARGQEVEVPEEIPRRGPEGQFFSPLVRAIAEKEGISVDELAKIEGTGREGRVTKQDVMNYVEQRSSTPTETVPVEAPPTEVAAQISTPAPIAAVPSVESDGGDRVEIVEMDRMRQIIAEHMVRSKSTSPHVTSFAEIDVTNLVKLRERNKVAFQEREGIKLSYTPFMVAAAVDALKEHPVINSSVDGKKIIIKKDYHIGIAVAIDTSRLVVPVIRDAGQLNLAGIAHAASDLAHRARTKKLQPDDLQGGTFTVTNVGSIGSLMGTPIINQPQVAILATGAIKKKPVVVEHPELGDIIAVRHMMFISLSYDHRIIDGALAASFLRNYTAIMEAHAPDGIV